MLRLLQQFDAAILHAALIARMASHPTSTHIGRTWLHGCQWRAGTLIAACLRSGWRLAFDLAPLASVQALPALSARAQEGLAALMARDRALHTLVQTLPEAADPGDVVTCVARPGPSQATAAPRVVATTMANLTACIGTALCCGGFRPGWTVGGMARACGISRGTFYALIAQPTSTTLARIITVVAACGYRLDLHLLPSHDVTALPQPRVPVSVLRAMRQTTMGLQMLGLVARLSPRLLPAVFPPHATIARTLAQRISLATAAQRLAVSPKWLRAYAFAHHLRVRKTVRLVPRQSRAWLAARAARIAEHMRRGALLQDIATDLDLSRERVRQIAVAYGINHRALRRACRQEVAAQIAAACGPTSTLESLAPVREAISTTHCVSEALLLRYCRVALQAQRVQRHTMQLQQRRERRRRIAAWLQCLLAERGLTSHQLGQAMGMNSGLLHAVAAGTTGSARTLGAIAAHCGVSIPADLLAPDP